MFLAVPPYVFIVEPSEKTVNQNENATFVCHAGGIPVPNITWVKEVNESTVFNSSEAIEIFEEIVNSTWRESVLTFLSTVVADESVYRCEGTNGVTNVISSPMNATVSLIVLGEFPSITVFILRTLSLETHIFI